MEYLTINNSSSYEFTTKRSKFIGYAKPINSEEEAQKFIAKIKTKHHDAKHNVFAYVIKNGSISRYSDDSEPAGAAGKMALEAISKSALFDVAIVVTRYFGGILLGTGGLSRAYFKAAKEAISLAGIASVKLCKELEINCEYKTYDKIINLGLKFGAVIDDKIFSDKIILKISLPEENLEKFKQQFLNLFPKDNQISITGEIYKKISQ